MKFVKNMVAGVTGMDLVAFIIAADEGIMPQTKEHFEICRLLGVQQGIIVNDQQQWKCECRATKTKPWTQCRPNYLEGRMGRR